VSLPDEQTPQVFDVDVSLTVRITVGNPSAITRCTENEDRWRETYYDIHERDEVLEHLAFNAVFNRHRDGTMLDGWADLTPDELSMEIRRDVDLMDVREVRKP
jgi:hypothetical protein